MIKPLTELHPDRDAHWIALWSTPAFRNKIRQINAMSMVSTLCDDVALQQRQGARAGAFFMRVHGQVHHNIGSLIDNGTARPGWAQLYVWDANLAIRERQRGMTAIQCCNS